MPTRLASVLGTLAILFAMTTTAGADGLPDILGIQLGMPARDAHAKLQSALPKNKISVMPTKLPTIDKPVILSFGSAPAGEVMMGMEGDKVTVDVTLPPSKQTVWRVERTHFFPNKGIPKKVLLASLREKYGKETRAMQSQGKAAADDSQVMSMLWLMDEQGHPSAPPPLSGSGVDPLWSCPRRVAAAQIVESPSPNYGNKDIEWCLSAYTAVNVEFMQSSSVPELYEQMNMMVVSLPLGSRAGHATMKWKQDIAEGQHRQEIEKAQQQEKPKL